MALYGYTAAIHSSYLVLSLKTVEQKASSHMLTVAVVTLGAYRTMAGIDQFSQL